MGACSGEEVERPARSVSVHTFMLQRSAAGRQDLDFRISCSKGTYIRSLAHDLVCTHPGQAVSMHHMVTIYAHPCHPCCPCRIRISC